MAARRHRSGTGEISMTSPKRARRAASTEPVAFSSLLEQVRRSRRRRRKSATAPHAMPPIVRPDALAAALRGGRAYARAPPWPHARIEGLFDEARLRRIRNELGALQRTFKETDLFRVYQTGDLANLDASEPEHARALGETLALREALYSAPFRAFVRSLTGCAPLSGKTDCSVNVYARGGHLLLHDDVISTRCVSYIIYLSRPGKKWEPELGGALEMYDRAPDGSPRTAPSLLLPPEFGSMVMFTVQPGVSYHAIAEVRSCCADRYITAAVCSRMRQSSGARDPT